MEESSEASGYKGTALSRQDYESAYSKDLKLTKQSSAYDRQVNKAKVSPEKTRQDVVKHDQIISQVDAKKVPVDRKINDLNQKLGLKHNIPLSNHDVKMYKRSDAQMDRQKYIAQTPTMKALYEDRKIVTKSPDKALSTLYDSSADKEPLKEAMWNRNIVSRKSALHLAQQAFKSDINPNDKVQDTKLINQLSRQKNRWVVSSQQILPIHSNKGMKPLNKAQTRNLYDDIISTNRYRRAIYYQQHPKAFKALKNSIDAKNEKQTELNKPEKVLDSKEIIQESNHKINHINSIINRDYANTDLEQLDNDLSKNHPSKIPQQIGYAQGRLSAPDAQHNKKVFNHWFRAQNLLYKKYDYSFIKQTAKRDPDFQMLRSRLYKLPESKFEDGDTVTTPKEMDQFANSESKHVDDFRQGSEIMQSDQKGLSAKVSNKVKADLSGGVTNSVSDKSMASRGMKPKVYKVSTHHMTKKMSKNKLIKVRKSQYLHR